MRPHHQRTIDRLVKHFQADENYLALIIGGSIARGLEMENSDVDFVLVATDQEYERRKALQNFSFVSSDFCDYPGGYVDGKIVNLAYLAEAARQGSEPTRWAFTGAFTGFSRIEDLQHIIDSIAVYQESEQAEKINSFYSQVMLLIYFVKEAHKRTNPYLLAHASTNLALFASRLVLAHNKMLFPGHKWLMEEVKRAPNQPDNFIELVETLLREPNLDNALALKDCVVSIREWELDYNQALTRFIEDIELNWRYGRPPVMDW
ncbi:MAG TPA: nucleotidyltransferase domain-containing protein [Chloroflexia bacterium]|nr:nucleotidyltransferase domain-containing protein [Chloroflexia bacterium]